MFYEIVFRKISRLRYPREPEAQPRWLPGFLSLRSLLCRLRPSPGCDLPDVPHLREAEEAGDHHGRQQHREFSLVTKTTVLERKTKNKNKSKIGGVRMKQNVAKEKVLTIEIQF